MRINLDGGLIYHEKDRAGMEAVVRQERRDLLETAALLRANGFTIDVLSGGTSFSGKMPELLDGITEIRSGHYIFNDCGQLFSGFAMENWRRGIHKATALIEKARAEGQDVTCDFYPYEGGSTALTTMLSPNFAELTALASGLDSVFVNGILVRQNDRQVCTSAGLPLVFSDN